MQTRSILILILFTLNFLYIKFTFSEEKKPVRITIYPTVIYKNIVGSSVTIIDYDTIKKSSYKTIGDLISKFSGVNFDNYYYGTDAKTSVRIRGFGEQASRNILILVNGVRLTDMTMAGANLSRINIDDVYQIEIIKGGSASTLFGDGASGGAVNIITKNPNFVTDKFKFKSSIKSFNSKNNNFSVVKKLDNFVIQSFASKENNRGYRENSNFESDVFNLDLTYLRDSTNRYFTKIQYSEQLTEIPGNITLDDFYIRPRYSRTPEDFGTEKVNSISLGSQNLFNPGVKLSNVVKLEDKDQTTSALSGNRYILAKTNLETLTANSKLTKSFNLNNTKLDADFGVDFFNSYYRAIGNDWFQTKYHNIANQKILEPFSIIKFNNSSNDNIDYELGFRYHFYELDADNYTTKKSLTSNYKENYAWSLGFKYDLEYGNNFFGHISRAFRSPRLDEVISLVNPTPTLRDIKHQYSNEIEFGFESVKKNNRYQFSLFKSLLKNQIYLNQTTFINENFDPSTHQGIEIEYSQSISDKINFKSNGTYIESYFTSGSEKGNETSYVPKLSGNASISYDIDNSTYTSLEYKYMGKQRAGNDPTYILPKSKSYQLMDLNITHKVDNFKIRGSINNIFNKKYYTNLIKGSAWSGNKPYVYPQPGRTLFIGLEANF